MTAATPVASYGGTYARASGNVTATGVSCSVGDVLVAVASTEDNGFTLATPTGGTGITWALADVTNVASYGKTYIWTATATSANSGVTISSARSGAAWAGIRIYRFSGSDGVGAVNKANGATGTPSVSLTTTQADSTIVYAASDWNAADGASRAWSAISGTAFTNTGYARDASFGTAYSGYWLGVGAAGAKTCAQTAPSGMKWATVVVEVKGTTGGATTHPAAGTVSASTAATGSTVARLVAAGVIAATGLAVGAATARLGASGTAAATSTTTGSATVLRPSGGTVVATSNTSGSAEILAQQYPASGTVAAVSTASGSATGRLPGSGTVAASSSLSGSTVARLAAAGSSAATSSVSGSASIIGGPVTYPAAGVVAVVSASTGTITLRGATSGSSSAASSTTGAATAVYVVGGTVAATSGTAGAAGHIDPNAVPYSLTVRNARPALAATDAPQPHVATNAPPALTVRNAP